MATISKDTPLSEITLRRYEKPSLSDRELVRKLCLSVGLLQPGDSRDVVVDVFYVLLKGRNTEMNSEQVKDAVVSCRKEKNLPLVGIASSNIRRQLKRLRELLLVEKKSNSYMITENLSLNEIMQDKIQKLLFPAVVSRVQEYFQAVDEEFLR